MHIAMTLEISDKDRETLVSWAQSSAGKTTLAKRAQIVLLAGEGVPNTKIARRVGVSRPTVNLWRKRYITSGLSGLTDRPRSGRPAVVNEAQVVVNTLETPPPLGATHWSSRLLGKELGISNVTVAKVWKKWGIQPWLIETLKSPQIREPKDHPSPR